MRRMQHQCGDGWLEPEEDASDHRHVTEAQVDPRQRDQDEQRRQHEQRPGDDAAPRAVHEPADVGGELLGLGAGQHHAVVQRVQEPLLADPASALDQLGVHDRDLPGRSAEADEAELQPEQERLRAGKGSRARQCCVRIQRWCRGCVQRTLPPGDEPDEGQSLDAWRLGWRGVCLMPPPAGKSRLRRGENQDPGGE